MDSIDRTMSLIDSFLKEQHVDTDKQELEVQPSDYIESLKRTSPDIAIADDKSNAKISKASDTSTQSLIKSKSETLLDAFLEKGSDVIPNNFTSEEDNDNSIIEDEDLQPKRIKEQYFTQTLARIYLKQHKYDKAMEIIRSLYLNFPNKNIYFADQIRFLEKLIKINQN